VRRSSIQFNAQMNSFFPALVGQIRHARHGQAANKTWPRRFSANTAAMVFNMRSVQWLAADFGAGGAPTRPAASN
jgi:hypothetical protein